MQETDASGQVRFTTIFPACYDGRWPHIHFEVYPSLAKATSSTNKIATSQMALTEEASKAVYATAGYEQSVQNLSQVSLDSDNVFSDGYDLQIPTITGDPASGYQLSSPARSDRADRSLASSRASADRRADERKNDERTCFSFAKSDDVVAVERDCASEQAKITSGRRCGGSGR